MPEPPNLPSRPVEAPAGSSRIEVTLEREYPSAEEAAALFRALEPDRPEYLEARCDGARLRFRVLAPNASSARATIDDLLAALSAAERARSVGAGPGGRRPAPDR